MPNFQNLTPPARLSALSFASLQPRLPHWFAHPPGEAPMDDDLQDILKSLDIDCDEPLPITQAFAADSAAAAALSSG